MFIKSIYTNIPVAYSYCVIMRFAVSTFQSKKFRRNNVPDSDMFLKVIEVHRDVLQRTLSTILNTVMFEDCKNQWSMSRPLLGLILLNEDYFR